MDEEKLGQFSTWENVKKLLTHARSQRGLLLVCLVGALLSSGVRVALPQLVKTGIDDFMLGSGVLAARLDGLRNLALGFVGLLVLGLVVDYANALGLNQVGQEVVMSIRSRLWAHFHRLPIQFFDKNAVGRLVTRVTNDTNALADLFTNVLATGLADFFLFFGILYAMMSLNPVLTGYLFLLCPFLLALTFWFKRVTETLYRELRVLMAQVNAFFQETVSGLAVVKSFAAQGELRRRFGELTDACFDNEMKIVHRVALFRPGFAVAQIVASAIVLLVGGAQINQDQLTVGGLVAFLFYLRLLFSPLQEMAEKFNVFQKAVVASERLFRILDRPAEPGLTRVTPESKRPGAITFDQVSFAYEADKPVLRSVSFQVEPGQTVALVGPTGSGKTTIVSLLMGFYELPGGQGSIEVDGVSLQDWNLRDLRRRIGFVHQELFLFAGDVRRNVALFEEVPEAELKQALRVSRADKVVDRFSKGLDHELREGGGDLSQGERQLLSFARALAQDPGILILDEATASIDSVTESDINQALEVLLEGRTALVIAHRLATVKNADKILVLHEGRLVEEGTHQELLQRDGLYSLMFESQLR